MNERQQAHINYFLERYRNYRRLHRDIWVSRLLAAQNADEKYPLRTEEEAKEVVDYLGRVNPDMQPEN